MVAAGLLAKKAVERGLESKPWVKTSLAPGSRVVTDYLERAGLTEPLDALGFNLVGYGCTTCIGNSGPLPDALAAAVPSTTWRSSAVLSGNRNFEGRIHPQVRANYLASPPLVVAYALAGTHRHRPRAPSRSAPAPTASRSTCATSGRRRRRCATLIASSHRRRRCTRRSTPASSRATSGGSAMAAPTGAAVRLGRRLDLRPRAAVLRGPAAPSPTPPADVVGARVLAMLGDSVTTDHISPAGSIPPTTPAGTLPDRARRRAARLQLATARGAATTR